MSFASIGRNDRRVEPTVELLFACMHAWKLTHTWRTAKLGPLDCIPTRYSRGWAYAWHNALAIIGIIKENDSVLKFRRRRPISVSHLTRRTSRKCVRSIYIDFYFVYFYFLYFTLYFYAITRLCVRVLLLLLLSWYFSSSKSAFSFITCLYITTCAICF